jgi:hypothetical protein
MKGIEKLLLQPRRKNRSSYHTPFLHDDAWTLLRGAISLTTFTTHLLLDGHRPMQKMTTKSKQVALLGHRDGHAFQN